MSTLILALLLVVLLGVVALTVANAATRTEHEPHQFTRDDPRCKEVDRKLDDARRKMRARGVKFLLEDRPAWKRVTGGQVIELRR